MVDDTDKKTKPMRFNPDIAEKCSATCPPAQAQPVHGKVYRGIRKQPISANDFLSVAELQTAYADPLLCLHWGLSVWVTEDAVAHARDVYRPAQKWHIASADLTPADGVIMATPSNDQPDHHTYWKPIDRDVTPAFTIIMAPLR